MEGERCEAAGLDEQIVGEALMKFTTEDLKRIKRALEQVKPLEKAAPITTATAIALIDALLEANANRTEHEN